MRAHDAAIQQAGRFDVGDTPLHLLLGLLIEGEGVAIRTLRFLDIDLPTLRVSVQDALGRQVPATGKENIFGPPFRAVVAAMSREALGTARYVGTEHLLLALATLPGPAADLLMTTGVSEDILRSAIREVLADPTVDAWAVEHPAPSASDSMPYRPLPIRGGKLSRDTFEHFDADARSVVRAAQLDATERGQTEIGRDHLLRSLVALNGEAARVLLEAGLRPERLVDLRADDDPPPPARIHGYSSGVTYAMGIALNTAIERQMPFVSPSMLLYGLLLVEGPLTSPLDPLPPLLQSTGLDLDALKQALDSILPSAKR